MTKSRMMRAIPIACSEKNATNASTSEVTRSIRSPSSRLAVIRETQSLDVIKEEISQASRDAFGGISRRSSGKIGERSLDSRAKTNPTPIRASVLFNVPAI